MPKVEYECLRRAATGFWGRGTFQPTGAKPGSTSWLTAAVSVRCGPEPGSERGAYKRDLGYWFAGFDLFGQNSLCATQQARI